MRDYDPLPRPVSKIDNESYGKGNRQQRHHQTEDLQEPGIIPFDTKIHPADSQIENNRADYEQVLREFIRTRDRRINNFFHTIIVTCLGNRVNLV